MPPNARRTLDSYLRRKYGITVDQYDELLEEQGGLCGICGEPPRGRSRLGVDHDHDTGIVRGLLCTSCNFAIGVVEWLGLQRLAEYLGESANIVPRADRRGHPRGRPPGSHSWREPTERERQITEAVTAGRTLQSVGDEWGVSRQRVHQIVKRCQALLETSS